MTAISAIAARQRDAETRFAVEGVPHRRIEAWHYSDLRAHLSAIPPRAPVARGGSTTADPFAAVDADLAVFANGHFDAGQSRLNLPPAVQMVDLLSADLPDWAVAALGASRGSESAPMADLALSQITGGIAIRVSRNFKAERPIRLSFVNAAAKAEARHVRVLIVLETGAELTLLEGHAGQGVASLTNIALELSLGANSRLTHLKIADDAADDTHVGTTIASIHANATYDVFVAAGSGRFARHEMQLKLAERMANNRVTGFELLSDDQHADFTVAVDHAVRDGKSDLVFRNVLGGRSRGVAQGKIIVREGADGTDSKQSTRALLLSKTAEADAKPELEIHADDVVCGHGVAIGDLDADAQFYLQSRGIPAPEARAMLTEAFLEEALERLPGGPGSEAFHAFVIGRLRSLEVTS
jgi:Fe-S cluster assembly protein SufD